MAQELAGFRVAVIAAAQQAMQAMELQMVDESFRAIQDFVWDWKGPISNRRSIINTGALMNSVQIGSVDLQQNSISFSLTWDPVDPDNGDHYAKLVHDGQAGYFEDDEGGDFAKDYTARPWTFLLIPSEQRDDSELNTDSGPTTESLPEDGWEASLEAFQQAFRQQLTGKLKVVR